MPKRSNEFQKLVYLVRVNLAAGATVTESKMLQDRLTGQEREVDVCVEGVVGSTPVNVCIECCDRSRSADVTWVEAMKAKHERLPTHALILASRSGFTKEAQEVAERYGIETISFDEVDRADFHALLTGTSALWTKCVSITAQKVTVRVLPATMLPAETVAVVPDNLIYAANGTALGPIAQFVQPILNAPYALRDFFAEGKEGHVWFKVRWEPPRDLDGNPLFLQKLEPPVFREIQYIEIEGPCNFKITEFHLRRGNLGTVEVAYGTTAIFGKEALVAATRDSSGLEKISVNIGGDKRENKL